MMCVTSAVLSDSRSSSPVGTDQPPINGHSAPRLPGAGNLHHFELGRDSAAGGSYLHHAGRWWVLCTAKERRKLSR
jgi:hypothetical protein